ncbi:hypothetical protein RintRC_2979 [Richelia intracellularis]|nr:hypothetical protein RintRC_2979 [Richelia intracellularis]
MANLSWVLDQIKMIVRAGFPAFMFLYPEHQFCDAKIPN